MKQNEIASLILIVAVSFTIAYFVGNAVFNKPENRSTPVEVVNPINGELPVPSPTIFNKNSINPTEDIEIDQFSSDEPFVAR
jgi:hypothetical protein